MPRQQVECRNLTANDLVSNDQPAPLTVNLRTVRQDDEEALGETKVALGERRTEPQSVGVWWFRSCTNRPKLHHALREQAKALVLAPEGAHGLTGRLRLWNLGGERSKKDVGIYKVVHLIVVLVDSVSGECFVRKNRSIRGKVAVDGCEEIIHFPFKLIGTSSPLLKLAREKGQVLGAVHDPRNLRH